MQFQLGQPLTLTISSVTDQGFGVGRADGFVFFVPFTAVGDTVACEITKLKKQYGEAKCLELLTLGTNRIQPDCPLFSKCGGCSFRHITYAEECNIKTQFVQNNLKKIGKSDITVLPCSPSPKEMHYRNNCQTPVALAESGKVISGFYQNKSHNIVAVDTCPLEPILFSYIRKELCSFLEKEHIPIYSEQTNKGLVKSIWLRCNHNQTEVSLTLVLNGNTLPHRKQFLAHITKLFPQITSVTLAAHTKRNLSLFPNQFTTVYGTSYLRDTLCGIHLQIAPGAFYQVNHDGAENLYRVVREYTQPQKTDTVLDLYCGTGSIGLSLAKDIKKLMGVEIVADAVKNARENAKNNNIHNAEFQCADSGKIARQLAKEGHQPTTVIVDPPRKGCSEETLASIVTMNPKKVVMVSCNSSTMSRDIHFLTEQGYTVKQVQPVDLFPRTHHIETIVLLQRQ